MSKKEKRSTGIRPSTMFSIISMCFFLTSTIAAFTDKSNAEGASPLIKYAVLPLIIIFAVAFCITILLNIRNDKAAKQSVTDTKYAVKTTKNTMGLIEGVMALFNVSIAILLAIDTISNGGNKFKVIITIVTCAFSLLSAVITIVKKVKKLKKGADKRSAAVQKATIAEENKQIAQARIAEKARIAAEAKANEPKKDQSKKPVKKVAKK
ncbi:MAG: hypothetical protein RR357_02195 [Clostridia bacterium]